MTSTAADSATAGSLAGWRMWVLLTIALMAWLPGALTLPPLDRDESRFAQASRQMVETGNYVDIRLGEAPRYNKPIGIYWLQAMAVDTGQLMVRGARDRIFLYRLPSFLCGVLVLFFTFWNTRPVAGPTAAFVSALVLGTTVLLAAESEIATTDAALLAAIVAAQGVLWRIYLAGHETRFVPLRQVLIGWTALGAGILIKGPVIVAVVGATAFVLSLWDREWRWLKATRPFVGLAITIGMVAPWAIAIGISSHGAFYGQSLGHDFAAKLAGGQESHGAPPGYYLALLNLTFWPATLYLLPALGMAVRRRNEPSIRFLLVWAVAAFVMFEAVPTKLPHYILPAYPALAILAGLWITEDNAARETRWPRVLRYLACAQFGLVVLAFAAIPFVLPQRFGSAAPAWTMAGAALVALAGGTAIIFGLRGNGRRALFAASTGALILYPVLVLGVVPQLHALWISEGLAAAVARDSYLHDPPVTAAGYAEPSLLFRLGGDTKLTSGAGAANITAAQGGGLAIIEDRERSAFLARVAQLQAIALPVDALSGFDYSRGREEHLTIYRVRAIRREATPIGG